MILIDGVYINKSGGKVLLELLLENIITNKNIAFFILDKRIELEIKAKYNTVQNFLFGFNERSRAKIYKNLPPSVKSILCFANVPPPVPIKNIPVYIYFHNALLLNSSNTNYSLIEKLKFLIKRLYIWSRNRDNYFWIVQTPGMKNLLLKRLGVKEGNIQMLPFYDVEKFRGVNHQLKTNKTNFLYVADGVQQKNHLVLLKAWEIMGKTTNHDLTLHLTIPQTFTNLIDLINRLNTQGLKIINHGYCDEQKLINLYSNCNYVIFPSLAESFGLPLIEAAVAGCEIISSDLPYIYDVIKPLQVFNPYIASSIVGAVLHVLNNHKEKTTAIIINNEIEELMNTLNK